MEERTSETGRPQPLTSILLPVDDLGSFARVAALAGLLLEVAGSGTERVELLHVVTATFLGDLMRGLDLVSGETPAVEEVNELRRRHQEDSVLPLLAASAGLLRARTGRDPDRAMVKDGEPARIISSILDDRGYAGLIMSRRNLAGTAGRPIGSVTAGVLHRSTRSTIYLVGDRAPADAQSLFCRCLIAVDDSPASMHSVAEAGALLARAAGLVEQIQLVHVLDQSCYYNEDGESCMDASLTGQRALEASGNLLIDLGIDREKIRTVIHFGKPGTILAEEVARCRATIVFMGRRDRSRLAQVYLGSVCTEIIQACGDQVMVLAS